MNDAPDSQAVSAPAGDGARWGLGGLAVLALALIWSGLGLTAWSLAAIRQPAPLSSSWLTTLALISAGITLFYRKWNLPETGLGRSEAALNWSQLSGLLAWAAAINWLGFILLRSDSLAAALPAVAVILLAELWVYGLVEHAGVLPDMQPAASQTHAVVVGVEAESQALARDASTADASPAADPTLQAASAGAVDEALERRLMGLCVDGQPPSSDAEELGPLGEAQAGDQGGWADGQRRRTIECVEASGQRVVSGEIRQPLAEGQKSQFVVVGFQPAFSKPPAVELECETDDVSVSLVNCTPAGMRIQCKRSQSAAATQCHLSWYACEQPSRPTHETEDPAVVTPAAVPSAGVLP